jgi:hypothetical protein
VGGLKEVELKLELELGGGVYFVDILYKLIQKCQICGRGRHLPIILCVYESHGMDHTMSIALISYQTPYNILEDLIS